MIKCDGDIGRIFLISHTTMTRTRPTMSKPDKALTKLEAYCVIEHTHTALFSEHRHHEHNYTIRYQDSQPPHGYEFAKKISQHTSCTWPHLPFYIFFGHVSVVIF